MLVCPKCAGVYPVAEGFCPMDGAPLQARAERQAEEDPVGEGLLGTVLDRRYRLDEIIGSGGMAFVYRATHTLIGKKHAIKVMRPELARDPELVRRFLREAQVVSSIKHPNVVDISDFGTRPDGRAFCVMEFLRGRTLADRIDNHVPSGLVGNGGGPLQPEEALGIALQICQGLQAAHDQGVVHRDLKPENIFICDAKPGKEPQVKLLDFGIARAGQRITIAGAVLGTPEYMSPEQAKGLDVDHRADIYGLGVILFEMLTGLVPFRSEDVALTMQSHIHAEPPTLASINTQLAYLARTDHVLRKLLAKQPDDRPRAAKSAAELLRDAIRGDLGDETATRLVKATMAIGSGGIGLQSPAEGREEEDAEAKWRDRPNKPWDPQIAPPARGFGAEAPPPSPAYPGAAMPMPVRFGDADAGDTTRRRRPPVPLIMGGTALVAAVVTVGMYGALGGFAGMSAAADRPAAETITIPASQVPPSVPTVAAPEPREIEEKRPDPEPVEAGGQEGEGVAADNEAGAAPSEETVPDSTSVSTQSDEGDAATEAKAKARKPKLDADDRPPPRGSKTTEAGREATSSQPQKTSESKENTPKKARAPGDLKDPFGRN